MKRVYKPYNHRVMSHSDPGRKLQAALVVCIALLAWQIPQSPRAESREARGPAQADEAAAHRAVVDRYCANCHNSRVSSTATASGVVFDRADLNRIADDPALWEKVVRKLRTGAMPPEGAARPDKTANDALAGFIESRLDRAAM